MKLSRLFGFVLMATLMVALSGNVMHAIPSGTADFSYVSFQSYFGVSTSLPVNPGDKDVVIGAFALKDCAGVGPFGAAAIGPSGSWVGAGLCTGAVADGFGSVVTQLDIIQVGGSAPAGTFTNVRAYLDTGTQGTIPPILGLVGRGVFNKAADQLLGTFTGDVATGATLSCPLACTVIGNSAGRAIYIVADVSPSAAVGNTSVIGLTVTTDNRDLGAGIVNSSTTAGGIFPPVQSQIQVAIGAAQTGQARGVASDITTQINVVNNPNPTVAAGAVGQIAQIIGICAAATALVPAPRPGTVFVGTLYPGCVNAAANFIMVPQQLVIRKQAGTLSRVAKVHVFVDRNGNDVPDASEEIGLGYPWPDASQPLIVGTAGNALLSGPPAPPMLTANGALASGAGCPAANLIGGNCGINLIITMDFDSTVGGTLQISTEIIAGDIPRLSLVNTTLFNTAMPLVSPVTFNVTGGTGTTTGTLQIISGGSGSTTKSSVNNHVVIVQNTGTVARTLVNFTVGGACTLKKVDRKSPTQLGTSIPAGGTATFWLDLKCKGTKPRNFTVSLTPGVDFVPAAKNGFSIAAAQGSAHVEVFSLNGKKVLETGFSGTLNVNSLGLPNGVYLYTITVQTPEGLVRSELRKLVIKN